MNNATGTHILHQLKSEKYVLLSTKRYFYMSFIWKTTYAFSRILLQSIFDMHGKLKPTALTNVLSEKMRNQPSLYSNIHTGAKQEGGGEPLQTREDINWMWKNLTKKEQVVDKILHPPGSIKCKEQRDSQQSIHQNSTLS